MSWPSRFDRYLATEILPPFAFGFVGYTFLFLIERVFDLLELAIKYDLPAMATIQLLALSVPQFVVLTLPISFLLGVLAAVGRLSAESELIAMRSGGVRFVRVLFGILPVALGVAALNAVLLLAVLPWGNRHYQDALLEVTLARKGTTVSPRRFETIPGGRTLFVRDVDPTTGAWRRIFLAERFDNRNDAVTLAREGMLNTKESGEIWLDLEGAARYGVDLEQPIEHQSLLNARQSVQVSDPSKRLRSASRGRRPREMYPSELLEFARSASTPERRREAFVELHKSLAITLAPVAFALIGLPLGVVNRRGGRGAGFAVSVVLIASYYVLLLAGMSWSVADRLPVWLGPWLPNLLFLVAGLWMLQRVEADRPALGNWSFRRRRPQPVALPPATKAGDPSATAAASDAALTVRADFGIQVPPRSIRPRSPAFPSLLDRYVATSLARVLLIAVASTVVIAVIVDYAQLASDIFEHDVPPHVVADYYRLLTLQFLDLTTPFAFLIAALVTLGYLARRQELTAAKAAGISVFRLALPIVLIAFAVGAGSFAYQDRILPTAGPEAARLKARIRGKELSAESGGQRWFADDRDTIIGFRAADRRSKTLYGVSAFLTGPAGDLRYRAEAHRAIPAPDGGWLLEDGWERRFSGGLEVPGSFREYASTPAPFRESLEALTALASDDRPLLELGSRIRQLEREGYDVEPLRYRFHSRLSGLMVAPLLALIAIPLATRFGHRGTMAGIGLGLGVGLALTASLELFAKLGKSGQLPPALAAWSTAVLFLLMGLWLLLGTET